MNEGIRRPFVLLLSIVQADDSKMPPLVPTRAIVSGAICLSILVCLPSLYRRLQNQLKSTPIPMEEYDDSGIADRPPPVSTVQTSDGTVHVQPFSEKQDALFVSLRVESPRKGLFVARYKHTGQWFFCRVRSMDVDGTNTIVWEDGLLQIGTPSCDLKRVSNRTEALELEEMLTRMRQRHLYREQNGSVGLDQSSETRNITVAVSTHNGMTVWEAARQGDMETCLTLIDRGDATPNDVELIGDLSNEQGRTPLYWACFTGQVELVRQLLSRGGEDADGTAYIAVTSQERANDNRDLMFDPDTNTFSDWVDYPIDEDPSRLESRGLDSSQSSTTSTRAALDDTTTLIRAMLVASKVRKNGRATLPARLYQSTDEAEKCVVCWNARASAIPVPCGHVACCTACLKSLFRKHEACPICRARIRTVVPIQVSKLSTSQTTPSAEEHSATLAG